MSDEVVIRRNLLQITLVDVTSHQAMPVHPDDDANSENEQVLLARQVVPTLRALWQCWLGHSARSYRCSRVQASYG